jgi:hypothetical protein
MPGLLTEQLLTQDLIDSDTYKQACAMASHFLCDSKALAVLIIMMYLLTAIGLSPGGSGYFTYKQTFGYY